MSAEEVNDYVIVGAGIAGIAIAEIFARSGHSVTLVEKHEQVCAEASGSHHCWFHFGSLYSIFPNRQLLRTLVGGIDDLLGYYSKCDGMNLRVGDNGKLQFVADKSAWIRDEPIEYIVSARNDRDFKLNEFNGIADYVRKLFFTATWDLAVKLFISRHQRFKRFDWRSGPASEDIPRAGFRDYSRTVINKVGVLDVNLEKSTHFRVTGYDRPMNARNIVESLLGSFLASGGRLLAGCQYKGHHEKSDHVEVEAGEHVIRARRLILTCGAGLERVSGPNLHTRIVTSPLVVAYPCVCDVNFVRLTPFVSHTINHLKHWVDGRAYSVIGGGYAADPSDSAAVGETRSRVEEIAGLVFPKLRDCSLMTSYVSNKTELSPKLGERNYQYILRDVSERVFAAVPGKFSLAFSLAVNTYKKLEGSAPSSEVVASKDDVSSLVSPLRHEAIVRDHLKAASGSPVSVAPSDRSALG